MNMQSENKMKEDFVELVSRTRELGFTTRVGLRACDKKRCLAMLPIVEPMPTSGLFKNFL